MYSMWVSGSVLSIESEERGECAEPGFAHINYVHAKLKSDNRTNFKYWTQALSGILQKSIPGMFPE